MRHKALAIPVVLAVAGVAAVAVGMAQERSDQTPTLDPAFIARIDGLCARDLPLVRARPALPAHPSAGELRTLAGYYEARLPFLRQLTRELSELGEPARARSQWDRLRRLVDEYVDVVRREASAAGAADPAAFNAAATRGRRLKDAIAGSAWSLGLTLGSPCARAV